MQRINNINRHITNIWGNKVTLFLFLLNLITNSTILSSYKSARDVLYWIAISALFSTIEAAFYYCFKRINMQKLFLIIVVFFHVFLSIVDIFLLYNFQQIFNQDTVDIIAQTNMEAVPQASALTGVKSRGNSGNISTGFIVPNDYKTCPNCNRQVDSNAKFCMSCGFNLEELKCPSCGARVKKEDSFCMNCGNRLESESICSSCGSKVKKGNNFCTFCGNKLN